MAKFEVTVTRREDAWPEEHRGAAPQDVPGSPAALQRVPASWVALQCPYQEVRAATSSRSGSPR
jgi:hypothetical protein